MIKSWYRFLHPRFQTLFLEYGVRFRPRYGYGLPPHQQLYNLIDQYRDDYADLLRKALQFAPQIEAITTQETDPKAPRWNNGFLPGLDIVSIYLMLAHFKPNKYIEVGSGNSTKVAYKAKQEQGLSVEITSIDPQPRAEIDALADRVIRKPFEDIDASFIIDELQAGDILFIDNSHRVLPNSDATVFFLEILPRLRKGVIVHIHDIYLPYDYPQFMCDRFYSEQYMLAAFILANVAQYRPLMPNYFISEDADLKRILEPVWAHPNLQGVERHGGSFWLKIC